MGKLRLGRLRDRLRVTQLRAGPGLAWVHLALTGNAGGKEPTALEHPGRRRPVHHIPPSPGTQRGGRQDAVGTQAASSFAEGTREAKSRKGGERPAHIPVAAQPHGGGDSP